MIRIHVLNDHITISEAALNATRKLDD